MKPGLQVHIPLKLQDVEFDPSGSHAQSKQNENYVSTIFEIK